MLDFTHFHWDRLPALRLLLPLMAGIIAATQTCQFWMGSYLPLSWQILGFLLLNFGLLLFVSFYKPLANSFRYAWWAGLVGTWLFFCLGYVNTIAHTALLRTDHFSHVITDSSFVLMRLDEPPIERDKSYKSSATVLRVQTDSGWVACSGKAMIYFERDSAAAQLKYGDEVLTNAPLRRVASPANPHEFDYSYYLQQQNVWHQAYLGSIFWQATGRNHASRFYSLVFRLRDYCLHAIQHYVGTDENSGAAAALIIGYTHLLEDDVQKIYSQTGVTHVLAVSGMHVGILAAMIGAMLSFLKGYKKIGAVTYYVLLIMAIWIFTFVAGASPSAVRASVMFTLLIGGLLQKSKNIKYNIIAASAFGILFFDPKVLYHVGFQLSYAAVLSIGFFQRSIESWWDAPNKISYYIWQIISVTLAAQVLTTPMTLYYFHQFPVYFIFANLFAVPLSGFVLNAGVLLLGLSLLGDCLGFLQFLAVYWGKCVWASIWLLNKGLGLLGHLPFVTWSGFAPTIPGVLLMYAIIFSFAIFIGSGRILYLRATLFLAIIAAFGNGIKQYEQSQQRSVNIYALKNGLGMEYIDGKNAVFIGDSVGIQTDKQQYHIQPYRYIHGITVKEQFPLSFLSNTTYTRQTLDGHLYLSGNFAQFYDKTLLLYDTTMAKLQPHTDINIDYLLLTQNPRVNLTRLNECIHYKHVIIDASNSRWRIKRWEKECAILGIPYYNVKDKGALVMDWNK